MHIDKFKIFMSPDDGGGAIGGGDGGAAGAGAGNGDGSGESNAADIREFIDEKGNFTKTGWGKVFGAPESFEKKFKSLNAAMASHGELERGSGAKVPLPGKDATDADWDAFYTKIGRPEKPDGYGLKRPDDVDASIWSDERTNAFSQIAHKLGLTPKQAQGLAAWELENVKGAMAEIGKKPEAVIASLKSEWGAQADAKLKAASDAAKKFGGDELLNDPYWGNNTAVIRAFAKIAEITAEKSGLPGAGDAGAGAGGGIQAEINKIMGDQNDPYWKSNHPQHEERLNYMLDLRRRLNEAGGR